MRFFIPFSLVLCFLTPNPNDRFGLIAKNKRWISCEDSSISCKNDVNNEDLRFVSDEILAVGEFGDQMNNNVTDDKA